MNIGLPEAYDDDEDLNGGFDDLAVEKIIKEGGRPPSQLIYPSIYAISQVIMNRLQRYVYEIYTHLYLYINICMCTYTFICELICFRYMLYHES
jgi:hypothetical protein